MGKTRVWKLENFSQTVGASKVTTGQMTGLFKHAPGGKNLLIDLPLEILEMIYELAFESDDCIRITQHRPSTRAYSKELRARMNTRGVTPLLRVNRFLYLNASPVFYRINKFVATAAKRRHWDCHELSRSHPDRGTKFHSLEQFIRVIPTQHLGCIRHLQLNMDGDNCSWCCRSILDIVTCHFPGLRILELDRFCNERVPDLVSNPKKCQRVFERTLQTLQRMRKLKKLQQLRITGFFKDLEFPRRVRESLKDVCRVDFQGAAFQHPDSFSQGWMGLWNECLNAVF